MDTTTIIKAITKKITTLIVIIITTIITITTITIIMTIIIETINLKVKKNRKKQKQIINRKKNLKVKKNRKKQKQIINRKKNLVVLNCIFCLIKNHFLIYSSELKNTSSGCFSSYIFSLRAVNSLKDISFFFLHSYHFYNLPLKVCVCCAKVIYIYDPIIKKCLKFLKCFCLY